MTRPKRRAAALAVASLLTAGPAARSQSPLPVPRNAPNPAIFDPIRAPEIVVRIGVRRIVLVPRPTGSSTTLSAQAIENKPNSTSFNSIIASSVAGAAAAPSGEIHIRGSHGQYTYFLDGAPLPTNVAGSFSDLINPKDIETLRVYTGGFPAQYGGQLAAIFDVTAKGGHGRPGGFVQQLAQTYSEYQTTAQYGASSGDFSYFASGIRSSSNIRLSPLTQTPLHDAGLENVGFGKFDYQSGRNDRVTLDAGSNGATLQVPNTDPREQIGQNDIQKEDGGFANLIWRHGSGPSSLTTAFYSHRSRLRYLGDPAHDLLPDPGSEDTSQLTTTTEDQKATYTGLRTDYAVQAGRAHRVQAGFDVNTVSGSQLFNSYGAPQADPTNNQPTILDDRHFTGGDRSVYLADDWTLGRLLVNYGARYDWHVADTTTSQLSPRLNLTLTAGPRDKFHAYYDRLFQPIPIESVIKLNVNGAEIAPFQPERDNFYEFGWTHQNAGTTLSLDAYYRTEKNTIDDQTFQNTQIDIPINFAKGYTKGLEASLEGTLSRQVSYYANYARSWAQGAGPIVGGLLGDVSLPGYFYDDHDQTHTASLGLSYENRGTFGTVDGEYGSGFPFYPDGTLGVQRVPPHFTVDLGVGTQIGSGQLAFTVNNLMNHAYVIKQADLFTNTEWSPGRAYGFKWTQNF